jgi:hypothetical protein
MKVRKLASVLLVLLMLLSMTACGSAAKSEAMDNAAADMYYEAPEEQAPELGRTESGSAAALPADRKLIRTIGIDAETEDLGSLLDSLTARIAELNGYVEAKELRNGSNYGGYIRRNLYMTVRIPADKADAFLANVSENTNVVSSSENVDDVTLQYVDTESRVKALETEQARLMELLAQAETLEDMLKIEDRLTDVRYELERYASYLRTMDNQISYATVNLSITEVKEYTPVVEEEPTVWQRIAEGFGRSLKDIGRGAKEFFIWVVVNSPYLLIWGIIVTGIVLLLRKRKIRKPKKTEPPEKKE